MEALFILDEATGGGVQRCVIDASIPNKPHFDASILLGGYCVPIIGDCPFEEGNGRGIR